MPDPSAPLIPRALLFGNPTRVAPRLSPDGRHLAWLAPDEGVLNVWVRPLADDAPPRPLTRDRGRGIQEYFWAEDAEHLLYVQDRDGDENWHLWSVRLDGSAEARDLTPFPEVQASPLESHPDRPHELLVTMNRRDPTLRDVHHLDLRTGKLELVVENPGAAIGWYADRALRVRGRIDATDDGGSALFLRDDEASPWREVARWPLDEIGSGLAFTPDGSGFWIIDSRGRDTSAVVRLDVATGRLDEVAHDPRFDVSGAILHPRTHELEVVSWTGERAIHRVLDPGIDAAWKAARELDEGDMSLVSRDRDDGRWIVAFMRDAGPVRYHMLDTASGEGRFLFAHRDDLAGLELASMQPVTVPASDGESLHGYLTLPTRHRAGARVPLVLHPHGGPWVRDTWGFNPVVQWLANRGYAVLQVNYRGSTGYGKRFLHLGDKEWGRRMQADLTDSVSWAVAEGYADPGRVAIMGASYGGYATLAGLAFTPEIYAAGVDIVGPSSLFTLLDSIPPYWEPVKKKMLLQVGDPESEPELLRERSPLFHVERIRAPLLIGQGANDPRVKEKESEQIVDAMRERGKEVVYVLYPDEGHGFARPENRLQFYGITEAFLARHLGGRAEPLPDDEHGGSGERR